MRVKNKYAIEDRPQDGEGRLMVSISNKESVEIAGIRIHLDGILATGMSGGSPAIRLMCIGPKTIKIQRIKR